MKGSSGRMTASTTSRSAAVAVMRSLSSVSSTYRLKAANVSGIRSRARPRADGDVHAARSPGGTIVLENPDPGSWHFNPRAPALERLSVLIQDAFRLSGGDWGAGREHLHLLREFGIEGNVSAEVFALPPGHP